MASKNKNGDSSDGLTARVELRLHPDSKTRFSSDAKKAGLSLSEYIRELAENGEVIINENSGAGYFDAGVVYELNKSGVNLMQFLKKFHSTGHPPPPDFALTVDEHRALLQKLVHLIEV